MWPVQELLSHSWSAQFYFCMDQKKRACQHYADPATHGLWVVLWSEGKGNCKAYHLSTWAVTQGQQSILSSRSLLRLAWSGLLFWVPGFWGLVLETGPGELLWLDHFLRKWLRPWALGSFIPEFSWGWWGVEIIRKWISLKPGLGKPSSKPLVGSVLGF